MKIFDGVPAYQGGGWVVGTTARVWAQTIRLGELITEDHVGRRVARCVLA